MEQPARNAIGANLRRIRTAKQFSQERLSIECARVGYEIPRATIAKIESGLRAVNDWEIFTIAHALKIEIPDLFPAGLSRRIRDRTVVPFHVRKKKG